MKTVKYIITLAMLSMLSASFYARTFEQEEKIYVNANQSERDGDGKFNWSVDNANLFLYVWKSGSSTGKFVKLTKENGNLYAGDMPADNIDRCIVVRKNNSDADGNWNNVWNKTGDITIPDDADRNCLDKFGKAVTARSGRHIHQPRKRLPRTHRRCPVRRRRLWCARVLWAVRSRYG